MTSPPPPPLSLYLHIPFCAAKCPYCDFASTTVTQPPEADYLRAVSRELAWYRQTLNNDPRPLRSLFFGGGTPSLVRGETIAALVRCIRHHWPLSDDCEITLEANPESVSADKIEKWQACGINRLSLGIQAFDERRLSQLGRIHTLEAARRAIRLVRRGGCQRLNLDLIHSTPGQTVEQWRRELHEAVSWEPDHLSCYQLTLEPGTPLHDREYRPKNRTDEERDLLFWRQTRRILAEQGFEAYEISNFSRPQRPCRHNLDIWRFGDYLGIGAAAHGKLTDGSGAVRRTVNAGHHQTYCRNWTEAGKNGGARVHRLSRREAGQECWMMGLRLKEGMRRDTYRHLTGRDPLEERRPLIDTLRSDGLLTVGPDHIALTEAGTPLADSVLARILAVQ